MPGDSKTQAQTIFQSSIKLFKHKQSIVVYELIYQFFKYLRRGHIFFSGKVFQS